MLYNLRMPDEYYRLAEKELADAVAEFLKTYSIDTAVYKAPTDYIYFLEKEINLKLGRRVRSTAGTRTAVSYRSAAN